MRRTVLLAALLAVSVALMPIGSAFANAQDDAAALAILGLGAGIAAGAMQHHHHYYGNPYNYGPGYGPRACWWEQRQVWNGYYMENHMVQVCQ